MPVAALILLVVFALVAGGARVLIQRRRTGDAGIRQFTVTPGSAQWWAHWGFVAGGLVTGVAAPVTGLLGLGPIAVLDHAAVQAAGMALAVLGILATFAAQVAMGASWRIGVDATERTALVTHGPFRLVRNPIFSTCLLAFLGLALMVPNPVAIAGFILTVSGIQAQVRRVEEPYLRQAHGTAYSDYASRVGRFVPGLGRMPQTVRGPQNRVSRTRRGR